MGNVSRSDTENNAASHPADGESHAGQPSVSFTKILGVTSLLILVISAATMHWVRQPPSKNVQHPVVSQEPSDSGIVDTNGVVSASASGVVATDRMDRPYLFILGVAQDAGFPQAGCYEPHCMSGWETPGKKRGAVALGLVASRSKYLIEATPDFPAQLYAFEQEAPSSTYPLAGIFVTHAHIGHYSGLMYLGHEVMGATNIPVYAMPRMRAFLENNGPWSQLVGFKNIALQSLENGRAVIIDEGVSVTPFVVPHRDEYSETVGFRIASITRSAVFIPDINKWEDWSEDLRVVIKDNDYALIDAAFFADGELPGRDMSKIPHPFVSETMALLDGLPLTERNKIWFIHMNHTNPLLRSDSNETQMVEAAGYHVAREGVRLALY